MTHITHITHTQHIKHITHINTTNDGWWVPLPFSVGHAKSEIVLDYINRLLFHLYLPQSGKKKKASIHKTLVNQVLGWFCQ
jgi:hypothetical protein